MPILKDFGIEFASEPENLEVRNIVNRQAISLVTGVGPVGAVRRTRAGDIMVTPTALVLDAPAGA